MIGAGLIDASVGMDYVAALSLDETYVGHCVNERRTVFPRIIGPRETFSSFITFLCPRSILSTLPLNWRELETVYQLTACL